MLCVLDLDRGQDKKGLSCFFPQFKVLSFQFSSVSDSFYFFIFYFLCDWKTIHWVAILIVEVVMQSLFKFVVWWCCLWIQFHCECNVNRCVTWIYLKSFNFLIVFDTFHKCFITIADENILCWQSGYMA